MKKASVTCPRLLAYGVLAAPVAFAGFPLYVLAPDFYATRHGVSLTSLGVALLLLRLFDALQDPLIGRMSDRFRRHRMFFMLPSAMILVLSIVGMFTLLPLPPLLWFVVCMGLAVTAYSVLGINLAALGALWTKDKASQTRIAASREAFGLFGLLLAVSLPALLSGLVAEAMVYPWFGLCLAVLMSIALASFFHWQRTTAITTARRAQSTPSFWRIAGFSNASRKLLLVYVVSMVASSLPAVLVIFFVRDLLDAEAYTGLFLALYFLSGAIGMPFWNHLSRRHGNYRTWFFSMLLAVGSFIWAWFLGDGDVWQYAVICVVSGAALGADLVFPPAILANHLHRSNAEEHASSHYALLTLTAKASLALASAVALPTLESFGFSPNADNSTSALMGLSLCYALIPCLLKGGAALLLWRMFIQPTEGACHENHPVHRHSRSRTHA